MLNYIFPIFNFVENAIFSYFSFSIKVGIWGALCGCAAMFVFYFSSDQKSISTLKKRAKTLRKKILDLDTDDSEVKKNIRENLSVSIKLLYKVLFPALLSTLPIIIVFLWMDVYYSFKMPEDGNTINIMVASDAENIGCFPEGSFEISGSSIKLRIQDNQRPIKMMYKGKMLYEGKPWQPPTRSIRHKKYWNALLKSEVGYLNKDISDIEYLGFGFQRNFIFKDNQGWYSRWELLFFIILAIASLIIKLAFKIE